MVPNLARVIPVRHSGIYVGLLREHKFAQIFGSAGAVLLYVVGDIS